MDSYPKEKKKKVEGKGSDSQDMKMLHFCENIEHLKLECLKKCKVHTYQNQGFYHQRERKKKRHKHKQIASSFYTLKVIKRVIYVNILSLKKKKRVKRSIEKNPNWYIWCSYYIKQKFWWSIFQYYYYFWSNYFSWNSKCFAVRKMLLFLVVFLFFAAF